MSEQWMGLHNPERHRPGVGACSVCETLCWGPQPCWCCLAAEVEALRAQVQADEEAERSLRERYNDLLVDHGKLTAQVQALRAQVQRVRELANANAVRRAEDGDTYRQGYHDGVSDTANDILRALDGDA